MHVCALCIAVKSNQYLLREQPPSLWRLYECVSMETCGPISILHSTEHCFTSTLFNTVHDCVQEYIDLGKQILGMAIVVMQST